MRNNNISHLRAVAAWETTISFTNWTRISRATAKLRRPSVLVSKGKVWRGEKRKKRERNGEAPEYACLASSPRAKGRVHIFSPSTHTNGRVDIAARFTASDLSGKMHRVPPVYRRPFSRFRRAPRRNLSRRSGRTARYSATSPFMHARENAKFPSHRHFGYYLPFTTVDTDSNLAPVANAQSPLTRVIERRDSSPPPPPPSRRNVTFNKLSSVF